MELRSECLYESSSFLALMSLSNDLRSKSLYESFSTLMSWSNEIKRGA